MEFLKDKFKKDLKTERIIEKELTVREAAKEIGVSASTISRIENGKTCEIESFLKICEWMGMFPEDYIDRIF